MLLFALLPDCVSNNTKRADEEIYNLNSNEYMTILDSFLIFQGSKTLLFHSIDNNNHFGELIHSIV